MIWIAAFFAVLGLTAAGLGVAAGVLIVFAVFVVLCRIAVRFFVRHLRKTRLIGLFGGRRRVCRCVSPRGIPSAKLLHHDPVTLDFVQIKPDRRGSLC
jgi:hypothetical protein